MHSGIINDFFAVLTQLMTEHGHLFEAMGMNLFKGFAVILISWFGVKTALSAANGGPVQSISFDHLASLLMTIAFGLGMMKFYSEPIPGIGVSFCHLITDQAHTMANTLDHGTFEELWKRITDLYWGLETPFLNAVEILRYGFIVLFLALALAVSFAIISFGYIAQAIAIVLGPLFIPFFIVPKMEWLFWGWFRAFIQYSFYPVIANAYIYVLGQLIIRFIDTNSAPYSAAHVAQFLVPLTLLLCGFIFGLLRIPSLVNSLFTGKSGESAIPFL